LNTDGYNNFVYIWNIPSFSLANTLTQPFLNGRRHISALEFSPDNRLLFARGINPDVFLFWDVQNGDLIYEAPAEIHESELGNPIAFSPDGRLLLALDSDGTIHVWGIKR
jgi:WD40 repeat protein